MDQQAEKNDKTERVNRTKQKNKRGDSKVESNDSPEIPDRGRHQTSPASLWGVRKQSCGRIYGVKYS